MKLILSLAFFMMYLAGQADVITLRRLFAKANVDPASNEKLIELTKHADLKKQPLLYAYHAAGIISMANHVYWPGKKYSYFNEGKEKLERVVNFAPMNVEIRFVRFSIQKGLPFLLGYYNEMEEDKQFILSHLVTTDWTKAYQQEVKDFLNS
tara:strand:- start:496 stop:951 length:456 start_codon:yes stop_codon:yes gene_type:complete